MQELFLIKEEEHLIESQLNTLKTENDKKMYLTQLNSLSYYSFITMLSNMNPKKQSNQLSIHPLIYQSIQ